MLEHRNITDNAHTSGAYHIKENLTAHSAESAERKEGKEMTLTATAKMMVISKNERESRDGKTKYYNLAVVQDGQAGNISCTEEVYDLINELMKEVELQLTYNDEYKSLRITGISMALPAPKPSGEKPKQ